MYKYLKYSQRIVRGILLFSLCFYTGNYLFANAILTGQDTLEKIKQSGVLVWGFDAEGGAPYVFRDPRDPSKFIGFEVELVEAIARELGVRVQYFQNTWDSILHSLQRGDFDIAMNSIEITLDRKEVVLFSRPYFVYSEQIVVRASDNRINQLEDLHGMKVGTLSDTLAKGMLEEMGDVSINTYSRQVDLFKDLLSSRIDAVFVDNPVAEYYTNSNPQLRMVGNPVGEGYYGIAVRKDDIALAEELNRAIEKIMISGRLKKIYRYWGLWNNSQKKLFLHGSH